VKWFDSFSSNTLGGTGNQLYFGTDGKVQTGCVYYKIFAGGTYRYSLLFSNIIESTYKEAYHSHSNLVCDEWEIFSAEVGVCKETSCEIAGEVETFIPVTFDGNREKTVKPGEFFTTDPVEVTAEKGDYLCLKITFCGNMIPYHLESVLPTFVWTDGKWTPDKRLPVPGMVGCDRKVSARIGFLGDSITQGVGTPPNSYAHWCALVGEEIGEQYSFWNLGIGYGRGQDAATDGAWLFKARQMDAVVVAFGSNDIGRGRTLEQMKQDMAAIVDKLHDAGIKVFLISVPPYDWTGVYFDRWKGINDYIVQELSQKAEGFLDIAPLLVDAEKGEGKCKYGTHPNADGCRVWADAMVPLFRDFLNKWL